jgi:RNA polymerase sigma-70 factor (ECF subfamily)
MAASADAEIVRRLAQDDPTALEDAFRAHASHCRAIAYRAVGDDTLAEDATQDAFLALWRHRAGLVVRAAGIGPWLAVVTRNAALNMARAGRRRTARELENASQADDAVDPTDVALANVQAADVREAIAGLPDEQRTVIAMAYFRGMTLRQVSDRTGAPLGTVKRRAQLALARLARALESAQT